MRSPTGHNVPRFYSVFVGHLALEVTKEDLQNLFEDCGSIAEVYIMKYSKEMCFTFGFVRFRCLEDAKRAVKDLNGWMLKGNRITVEISRETVSFSKSGSEEMPKRVKQMTVERPAPRRSHGETSTDHMVGLKNLARLRDASSIVNFDLSQKSDTESSIGMGELLNDVSEETYSRPPAQVSKLHNVGTSMEKCLQQLRKCHCSTSCASNKSANQLIKSMRHIINNISDYLDTTEVSETDHQIVEDSGLWNESNSEWNLKSSTRNDTSQAENTDLLVKEDIKDEVSQTKTVNRSRSSEDDSGNLTEDEPVRTCSSSDYLFSYDNNKSTEITIKKVLGRGRDLSGAKQALHQLPTTRFIGRGCALAISSGTKLQQNHW